ncbi:MAG TPA: ScyD/ScyE family protein [Blastocatellia bacterium]|nr:ScyD/ScyE family protein [Blastocatellia bacterium]
MTNKRFPLYSLAAALVLAFTSISASAQSATTSVLTAGLKTPTRIIVSPKGNLLVAEAGNGPNTGRISIIDPATGSRRTLVDGLPSGFAPPEGDASGPSGLEMRGRTLYVVIGAGDGTMNGPVPGTELPNPNPSSPFLSSVLSIRLSALAEDTTQGFTIAAADQGSLGFKKLSDGAGNELVIELVTNFRNFSEEPIPGFPTTVRASNPFGIALRGNTLYVVDASQNLVWEVDSDTGATRRFVTFASRPNPLPFGPPFIDPVPDNVRLMGKSLLVPLLTGFPFPGGSAEVRKIRLVNTANEPFITGLSSAIDVLPAKNSSGQDQFFTLEFSTDMLANGPGRLMRFDGIGGSRVVLVDNLISPTGMAQNPTTGDLYIVETFPGLILRVKTQ